MTAASWPLKDESRVLTSKEQEAQEKWQSELEDSLLLEITSPVDDTNGRGAGITLYVNGKTICGNTCSAAEWANFLGDWEKQSTGAEHSMFDDWASDLREECARYEAAWSRANDQNPTDQDIQARWTTFRFIYLLNAYEVTSVAATIPKGGSPMRVRRSSVDAWSRGMLATSET